jgi:hypothetical protein
MTLFINLRATPVGGVVAGEASAWDDGTTFVSSEAFSQRVAGRDLVFATHGFNVSQQSGIEALSQWSTACGLPPSCLFVGVLWPGDSRLHVFVDYVYEGVEAIASGKLLATYLNAHATRADSLSFSSHSLGARTVLEAARGVSLPIRRLTLMAGAIEDNCLAREYHDVAERVQETTVIASTSDAVLQWAFPAGNLIGEILMRGHPYDRTALGRRGPARPLPQDVRVDPWQIPDKWDYGHLDYLPKGQIGRSQQTPVEKPGPNDPAPIDPANPAAQWKPAWSAGVLATKSA